MKKKKIIVSIFSATKKKLESCLSAHPIKLLHKAFRILKEKMLCNKVVWRLLTVSKTYGMYSLKYNLILLHPSPCALIPTATIYAWAHTIYVIAV